MTKMAVLVMDVQKDFISDRARMPVAKHHVEPMLEGIGRVVEIGKHPDVVVVYIDNQFEKKDWIANFFRRYAAMKGQTGAEFDERLPIVSKHYFSKSVGSAFSNMEFRTFLKQHGIEEIVITGLFAEGCVSATAKSARKSGFQVCIVKDAIASKTDRKREIALSKLRKHGVSIIYAEDLLKKFEIRR